MTKLYIEVVAPMDQVFIGPFDSAEAADAYAATVRAKGHDAFPMTEAEMRASMAEFGEIPIQSA